MAEGTNRHLTTAQLAERTGVAAATLRVWETRHGFPQPMRLPGGHRRYAEGDVELVREVRALRDEGLSLPAAIERARRRTRPAVASVFAGLRRRRPGMPAAELDKTAVLALTRAIEDEYCARAGDGVLIGSFQREHFYRRSERRWRELARTADIAVALADFAGRAEPPGGPVEIPVTHCQPLAREWTVVICSEAAHACLAAWEQPTPAPLPDARRRFEVLWSFDPSVAADAVRVVAELLAAADAVLAADLRARAEAVAPGAVAALDHGGDLAHRMVGYLAGMLSSAGAGRPGVQG